MQLTLLYHPYDLPLRQTSAHMLSKQKLYILTTDYSTKQEMKVYDISNPTNPSLLSTTELRAEYGDNFSIMVEGDIAYVAGRYSLNGNYHSYLNIYNIADSSSPSLQGSLELTSGYYPAGGIAKVGDYLYIGTGNYTEMVNISDKTNPIFESEINGYFTKFSDNGFNMDEVYAQLLSEGLEAFENAFQDMLDSIK